MNDRYRTLLLTLLPLLGCPPADKADTADTADTATDTDTATSASETGWLSVDAELTECPAPEDVALEQVTPATCGATVLSVDGAGTVVECPILGGFAPTQCCEYPISVLVPEEPCAYGRPLVLGGRPRLAPLVRAGGWSKGAERARGVTEPDVPVAAAPGGPAALADPDAPGGPAADSALAAVWARVGLEEHASIASFSRFALDLLALGAPAELVAAAHQAALDEVRHATLAFGLASTYAGAPVGPGPLALGDFALSPDLASFAAATAREGCIAETLSALQVAEARDRATDPAIRAALTIMARDEARHAELAWRSVRWALTMGGSAVRAAVTTALTTPPGLPPADTEGLLPADAAREVVRRGWNEVVAPAAAALLADGDGVGISA